MKKKLFIFFSALITLAACSSSDSGEDSTSGSNYDRKLLLTNWADNIIIPSYTNYEAKIATLAQNVAAFTTTANQTNLAAVRTSWLEAYKAYQYVAIYSFGKSEEISFKESANTYPTNVTGIENNILADNYNLALLSQFDKQGFPALDYLLHGLASTDAAIIAYYSTDAHASKYQKYLTAVTAQLATNANLVTTDWKSNYRDLYIANSGASVSGSVAITTNNFVKNLEKDIRSGKIGIPCGVFSNATKFPEKVEAYYKNNLSKELLNTALQASQDFFNGKHYGSATTGEGLKTYLDYVNAMRGGQKLSQIILQQYAAAFTAIAGLDPSFSTQITNNNTLMIAAYDVVQQNVIYTKLDMMQALNITIDYVDSDGD